METSTIISVAGVILGGGTISAVITTMFGRKKMFAEGRSIEVKGELAIVGAATDLVQFLRQDIEKLRERVDKLEDANTELKKQIKLLRKENEELEARCVHLEQENIKLKNKEK